jgi:hypothetical protein
MNEMWCTPVGDLSNESNSGFSWCDPSSTVHMGVLRLYRLALNFSPEIERIGLMQR